MSWAQETIDCAMAVFNEPDDLDTVAVAQMARWYATILHNICLVSNLQNSHHGKVADSVNYTLRYASSLSMRKMLRRSTSSRAIFQAVSGALGRIKRYDLSRSICYRRHRYLQRLY